MVAAYLTLQNNTHPTWYKDKGLRRMAVHIGFLYLCVFTFGYDGALLNGLQALPRWQADFDRPTGSILGLIAAVFYIPKVITPWISSWIADRWGRRWALLVGAVGTVAGALVNTFANDRATYMAGRAILGGALGMHGVIAPPMIQELCHPRLRAVTGGMLLSMFYVGSTTAAWLCFGLVGWNNSWAWRLPTLLQCAGTTLIGVYTACGFMVESPRWLVKAGREEEAHKLLAQMHANGQMDDELVMYELSEIKQALEYDRLNKVGYMSFIAGINGGIAIWGGLTIILVAQFVERLGRRPLWFISSSGILVCFACITAFSGSFATTRNASIGTAVIPFLFFFTLCYNCGWAVLANLCLFNLSQFPLKGRRSYPDVAEMLPNSLRAKGMSIYVTTQAVSIAFNQYVNPVALEAIAWRYYLVYLGLQILLVAFTYFFCIETKGRTMEEVARLFDAKAPDVQAEAAEVARAHGDEKDADEYVERK